MKSLGLIKSLLTKMPFISFFSSSPPAVLTDLHSPGPRSFQLEIISPSSPLRVLYFYFSSFIGTSLSNQIVSSLGENKEINSWFAQI